MKRKIALVQGEQFRCVAMESGDGQWVRISDGSPLPRVLEVVRLVGHCEPSFFGLSERTSFWRRT